MGDWGTRAWESDEAADWFHRFWSRGWTLVEEEIDGFDPDTERFDSLRAAAHVLASFGSPYMVPAAHLANLRGLLDRAQELLRALIDPERGHPAFREICEDNPTMIARVEEQIAALRERRSELAR